MEFFSIGKILGGRGIEGKTQKVYQNRVFRALFAEFKEMDVFPTVDVGWKRGHY